MTSLRVPPTRTAPAPQLLDEEAFGPLRPPAGLDDGPWLLAARADAVDAETRAAFAESLSHLSQPEAGRVLLVTCHRVELYGVGPAPDVADVAHGVPGLRVLSGRTAVEHVVRLTVGMESAVLGEDQILHQVRTGLREAQRRGGLDPRLNRLFQLAIGAGREARAGWRPGERTLGDRAIEQLELAVGSLAGRGVLVVGTGEMGMALVRAAAAHGVRLIVGSRRLVHARDAARQYGGRPVDLVEAAELAPMSAALAVALGGPWTELDRYADRLPPTVDLSSPSALSAGVRGALGSRFTEIDDLFEPAMGEPRAGEPDRSGAAASPAWLATGGPVVKTSRSRSAVAPIDGPAFVDRASRLVAEVAERYAVWLAGRRSVETIRALRGRAEARRREELDRLLRRLPDLDPRERELVTALSSQLVAAILHEPLARLRDDVDGSGAEAARRLFDL